MNIKTIDVKEIFEKRRGPARRNIVTVEAGPDIPEVGRLDYKVRDDRGQEYLVEVKTKMTRLELGLLAAQATLLHKKMPTAHLVLICNKAGQIYKEVLKKLGVDIIELADLPSFSQQKDVMSFTKSEKTLELSPKEQQAYFLLLRKGIVVVTTDLLSKELKIPHEHSKHILSVLTRKGMLSRFGRGKYVTISPDIVYDRKGYTADPMAILDQLMSNESYYVAYASALYVHGLALQIPFETTVAVTRQRRPIKIGNSVLKFVRVNNNMMFGFDQQKYLNAYVSVSDLEKTVIDCIDRHDLCGGMEEVTRSLSESLQRLEWNRMLSYLKKSGKEIIVQRLGLILEKLLSSGFQVDPKILNQMQAFGFKHTYRLDFTQPYGGKWSKEWKIFENVDCMGWNRQNA